MARTLRACAGLGGDDCRVRRTASREFPDLVDVFDHSRIAGGDRYPRARPRGSPHLQRLRSFHRQQSDARRHGAGAAECASWGADRLVHSGRARRRRAGRIRERLFCHLFPHQFADRHTRRRHFHPRHHAVARQSADHQRRERGIGHRRHRDAGVRRSARFLLCAPSLRGHLVRPVLHGARPAHAVRRARP